MKKTNDAVKLSRYMSEFIYDYAPNFLTYSHHTVKAYVDTLTLYVTFLEKEGVAPNDFTRKHFERGYIERWLLWLSKDRNCCPDTCNVRLGSLRVFLEYLGTRDVALLYLYQEAKMIKRLKCVKKKAHGLTREAVTAIMNEPDLKTKTGRRDLTLLMLLYGTAARLGEILSLRVENLHLNAQKPYVNLYGKGGKMRTAYLLPRITSNLMGYLQEFHGREPYPDAYLFYSRVGEDRGMLTETAIDKRIKKYAKSAHEKCLDVPVNTHAHQFRHAKASHWLEDGINVAQVSFLLGHESLETTMKYLDITSEDKIDALVTLESEKGRNIPKKWKTTDGTLLDFIGLRR
ncbi:integrase [Neglecta sp. X4]|uniref:tyrosine-type recombinase/integrase n=1 Tax=unclassified Neglectibacter TaxID=2632164 RepID=UPI0013699396|nr:MULTISPECIES: tyrosine-type recombinase/integrase [unclassified Neglectibacter]NBI18863.1 integrase [Neglectibacter sp. 59]NBJ74548.1 integrase [Neglectibacter sp. X4]NCE82216.1 integrase [Neglectibacter sp. X58]